MFHHHHPLQLGPGHRQDAVEVVRVQGHRTPRGRLVQLIVHRTHQHPQDLEDPIVLTHHLHHQCHLDLQGRPTTLIMKQLLMRRWHRQDGQKTRIQMIGTQGER